MLLLLAAGLALSPKARKAPGFEQCVEQASLLLQHMDSVFERGNTVCHVRICCVCRRYSDEAKVTRHSDEAQDVGQRHSGLGHEEDVNCGQYDDRNQEQGF